MIKKDITFIYMDSSEKSLMKPIADEAEKRGYVTRFTDDKFAKCEIGFYCQHVNFPQYSKFSAIMLHDIVQQFKDWPDIWIKEPWNKYDVGFLPNNQWVENWTASSVSYYARPRFGVYKAGWPKADLFANIDKTAYRQEFNKKYGLDSCKRTVLYAPSWENDNKQDEFVQAMMKLDVNIVIKQHECPPEIFPENVKNINLMAEKHRGLKGIWVLPPSLNIFEVIPAVDVLVSDESSTMCEATMMNVPAVAVSNWLIPDTTPSRMPENDYDFVIRTAKENLSGCVGQILDHYPEYLQFVEKMSEKTFSNAGKASTIIMDVIDSCITDTESKYEPLEPLEKKYPGNKKMAYHLAKIAIDEIHYNWCHKSALGETVLSVFRAGRHAVWKIRS